MKRTLSLILAVVMVAIMVPFAAIATSAADESANLVELDESKYSPIYSVDFTTLNSTADLAEDWSSEKDFSDTTIFNLTEEGLKYNFGKYYFALNAVEFNATDDYVVEFTAKMPSLVKRLGIAFADQPVGVAADTAEFCVRDDNDNEGLTFKNGIFYTDATYSESKSTSKLSSFDADAYAAITNNANVRFRIFVNAGVVKYLVMSVEGFGDYFVMDEGVAFGKTFFFGGHDGTSDSRYITFQSFTVNKIEEKAAEPAIVLPEGWVMTADDGDDNKNYQNENGLVLYGDTQSIAMTTKVGVGQKRVVAVDFGTPTKVNILNVTFGTELPVAGAELQANNTAGTGGNDVMLCVLGGPDQNVTDGASFGMKGSNSATTGTWFNADGTSYIKKAGSDTYASAAIKRWTVGNALKNNESNDHVTVGETLYNGACTDNGMKMTMYIEIDENNYVTGVYVQVVTVDTEGNFKQETVIYYANGTGYQVSCDGYLTIGHSGWGENCALMVKSVAINAGTAKEMGASLYSANFGTPAEAPEEPETPAYIAGIPGFPEITNAETILATDFTTIKTDAALNSAGWYFYGISPTEEKPYVERVEYGENGLDLLFGNSVLVNADLQLNNTDTYVIDYTFRWNPSQWIFYMAMGFDPAALEGAANMTGDQVVAKLRENWSYIDGNSCFKIRANESDNAMGVDSWTHYDEQFMSAKSSGAKLPSATALEAACGDAKAPIRIRIIVSEGTGQYAFMTIGDEHFYLKRNALFAQDAIAGLIGFTMAGSAKDTRGVTLVNFNVIKCELVDVTGGTEIKTEKDKAYTDAAATYYKDGYVLHYMDFATEGLTYEATNYSFTSNSSLERIVKIEDGVLKITNTGSKAAYLLFTANAIPAAITEYTASYTFRFVGNVNSYFGFVRGLSLKDDGSRDKSSTIELSYKGEIDDCVTADEAAWAEIVTAMKAGEWVNVTISNVGRYVESVTVMCGDKTVTFKMEGDKNKIAVDGYMGFILGKTTSVEIADVVVCAGKVDNITMPVWPTGVTMGANVQDVTAEAVAEGTKPDYSALIAELTGEGGGNTDDEPTNTTPEQTTAATTTAKTTAATTKAAEAKKGCKGSIVALPAIIATAIFGCAVV
ncbi:MAG: hypothetical protein J6Q77_03260, partial [Clostridia bacterium]|nr:hypothetical protein [Clostridia bacterium]